MNAFRALQAALSPATLNSLIRSHRTHVVLVLAASAALLGLAQSSNDAIRAVASILIFMLALAAMGLTYALTVHTTDQDGKSMSLGQITGAIESVNGKWWQSFRRMETDSDGIVIYRDYLSVLTLALSPQPGDHMITGNMYLMAEWKRGQRKGARATPLPGFFNKGIGFERTTPVHLVYTWKAKTGSDTEGFGFLEFEPSIDGVSKAGRGRWASGDIKTLTIDRVTNCDLRRLGKGERKRLKKAEKKRDGASRQRLLESAYEGFLSQLGDPPR